MNQLSANSGGRAGNYLCALALDRIEPLLFALGEDSDQIDDDFSIANRSLDQTRKAHIGPDGTNLSGPAEPLKMINEVGMAHRYAQPVVLLGKSPHHMSAEEPRPAEDCDDGRLRFPSCSAPDWMAALC